MKSAIRTLLLTWSVVLALLVLVGGCKSKIDSIDITPATVSLAIGGTQQLTATAKYNDDTPSIDVTMKATWSSSDTKIATVDAKGVATGVAAGKATITAEYVDSDNGDNKLSASLDVTVTTEVSLKAIAVGPSAPSIAAGTGIELTATGTYSDNTTKDLTSLVTWTSSDTSVVTVDAKGMATGVAAGSATIKAAYQGLSGTTMLTVKAIPLMAIEVTCPDAWMPKGMNEQFTATGVFADATKQDLTKLVTWSSSSAAMTISNVPGSQGLAKAASEGSTTISATLMGVTGYQYFQVTAATLQGIAVTPFNTSMAKGTQVKFNATGVFSDSSIINLTPFVKWTSSDGTIAALSTLPFQEGYVTGMGAGEATITATIANKSGSAHLVVTGATLNHLEIVPVNPAIAKGTFVDLMAIGTFSDKTAQDLTAQAMWGSSDPSVATVSNVGGTVGRVTSLKQGSAIITASVGGKSDSTTLTVTQATLTSVSVWPVYPSIAKGTNVQFWATGLYSDKSMQDLTKVATWSSSDPTVATLSNAANNAGLAFGQGMGTATIKATFGGVSGATVLTVTAATLSSIEVNPVNAAIAKGTTQQFTATGIYSDDSVQDLTRWVTWSSSDASVGVSNAYDNHGLATGLVEGKSTIKATFMGGVSGSTSLTVTAATLSSVSMSLKAPAIAKGTNAYLHLIATYSDNSNRDVSWYAAWSSSDATKVTVDNAPAWAGRAHGQDVGSATITASYGGLSDATTVTVTSATLSSLAITPPNPTLAKGTTLRMTVTGTYSDASTEDVTDSAVWSTSDVTKALISNLDRSEGLVTAVSPGTVTISATFGGMSATTNLTVTSATIATISVKPANGTMATGATLQYYATATFTDNSLQDVTNLVTWSADNGAVVLMSNAIGSHGLATAVGPGTTNINAKIAGKGGTTQVTVQ